MLLGRNGWAWCGRSHISPHEQWQLIRHGDAYLLADEGQRLLIRTRKSLPIGWYLFGIRHQGDNPRTTGWLTVGNNTLWRQGRPMYPVRRRWRIVRISQPSLVTLELQRVQQPLLLHELWLIRVPSWDAWRRIRRRLKHSLGVHVPREKGKLWRAYNQLLAYQAQRHSLVPYGRWQRLIEDSITARLSSPSQDEECKFKHFYWGEAYRPLKEDEWLIIQKHDSRLAPWTLAVLAKACRMAPEIKLFYGDEDLIDSKGNRCNPQFKPAWNRELFWCDPNYGSCWIVSASLWNRWLLTASQEERTSWQGMLIGLIHQLKDEHKQIGHIPVVLSHRLSEQPIKYLPPIELQSLLIQSRNSDHYTPRVHVNTQGYGYRLEWPIPANTLLSVIIPTRDGVELLKACLGSINGHPAGCDIEIIIADNGSQDENTLNWLQHFEAESRPERRQHVVRLPGPFNYSAINNRAALHCRGSALVLLNNDIELLSDHWGRELASNALRSDVGCVGAQLLYPDHRVQHGGVILGIGGIAGHSHQDYEGDEMGYYNRLQLTQELSAVTGACLAISHQHWQELGGLDERSLAVNYNDVDLCLRAKKNGLRNLYLPQVRAIHHESKSRGRPEGAAYRQWRREWNVMEQRWGHMLSQDPAYSPHLSLEAADWSLALRRDVPLVR